MGIGLSFGKKKQKINTTTDVDRTDFTNQSQTGSTNTSGVTQSNTSSTATGSTTGQQSTSQTGTNISTGQSQGTSQQTTSAFSDSTLGAIEAAVGNLFNTTATKSPVSTFDPVAFVRDGVDSMRADVNSGLDADINSLMHGVGGTTGSNSMAALLGSKLRNEGAAKVAGTRSALTGQAEEIVRSNALAGSQVAGQDQNFLANLLQTLKGGVTTTTGIESQQTSQNQQTQNTGTTNTAEQTQQAQQQQAVQIQQLQELINQLTQGTNRTVGTERTQGTTTSSGGGISATF